MNKARFLSIDCGTQSLRAFVFNERGHLLARSQLSFDPPYFSVKQGYAEQDANYYWQCLVTACQQLWQQGVDPNTITAATLTTQRGTVVLVDEHGNALHPAILWLDEREAESLPSLAIYWQKLHQLSGHQKTIRQLRLRAQANWFAVHRPDIWAKTHKFLLLSGFLTYKLTGEFKDAVASQVGYIPFDYKKHQWHHAWDWRWQALGLSLDKLPKLVAAGKLLGQLPVAAAQELGLPAGLAIVAAGADKACEVMGAGCVHPWQGALSFGTTATYNTISYNYISLKPPLPPYPALVPQRYCLESQIPQGFALVNYFRRHIAAPEIQAAEQQGKQALEVLETWLASTPAGANGLLWQPSLSVQSAGESISKGALLGLSTQHTKADWYRALVEGLLFALKQGQQQVEQQTKQVITQLFAAGGGSQSDAVMQTAADIFNMPINKPHTSETSGLGAAMCAAVGMRIYPDLDTAVAAMSRIDKVFYPNAVHARFYQQCYQHVYLPWLDSLAKLYQQQRLCQL
ncbi:FGGY-family carbohydrate kinase [Agitococcus lubricus]|uniref:Sugar (Pentulose or hexulose) kinase n=1 Tax=Agitococcus lubricus TaxID=1077255 RepID=A0A2T5IZD8_9GAMM|nr:FGGY-family carbohydrate kinase [Agitococcus lubricus]PTQ89418.1 sugar (pentulose or hexulose) kinase [Agitococcus lubricus]